jgi:WhiB family transcriptional regulator, redox-sensing transcriptional regulator
VERGESTKEARAVCAQCSVREQCLAYALNDPDARAWGVWGGTTPRERREMNLLRATIAGLRDA